MNQLWTLDGLFLVLGSYGLGITWARLTNSLALDRDRPKSVRSACRRLPQNVSVPLTRPASLRSSRSAEPRSPRPEARTWR